MSDDANADFHAASCYATGTGGAPRDGAKALQHYISAAAAGHAEAQRALYSEYESDERVQWIARSPALHELAVRELTGRRGCSDWLGWLSRIERCRFFTDDVAMGDRSQQLAWLCGSITAVGAGSAPPPSAQLLWLLVDLVDVHPFPALALSGGRALIRWIATPAAADSAGAEDDDAVQAATMLLTVLAEQQVVPEQPELSSVWRDAAAVLVRVLQSDGADESGADDCVPALQCAMMPCVLPHTDVQRMAAVLKRSISHSSHALQMACRCVQASIATGDQARARALVDARLDSELFQAVVRYHPHADADATQQEAEGSKQDTLQSVFYALRALLSTCAVDGRIACAAPSLMSAISLSLRASHPVSEMAYSLLLESITRPWPVFEGALAQHVSGAVLTLAEIITSSSAGDEDIRDLMVLFKAFVGWLPPDSDWSMVPMCVTVGGTIETDDAASTEWCAIISPRVAELSADQVNTLCKFAVLRSPGWLSRKHPTVFQFHAELLKRACTSEQQKLVYSLTKSLDQVGAIASALQLESQGAQTADFIAQVARARRFPELECRDHSSHGAGQYLSLLVQAHVAPRLQYDEQGVRAAFKYGHEDLPMQALIVDTWTNLTSIPESTHRLIATALDEVAVTISDADIDAVLPSILFRLISLCQHSHASELFARACSRGLEDAEDVSFIVSSVPVELTDVVFSWFFSCMSKPVLSGLLRAWLKSRSDDIHTAIQEPDTEMTAVKAVEEWMLSSASSASLALHLLADMSTVKDPTSGDLECSLLGFLQESTQYSPVTRVEICQRGFRGFVDIVASCVGCKSRECVAVKALYMLQVSLTYFSEGSAGVLKHQYFSEHLVPLIGVTANLLSTSLDAQVNSSEQKNIISRCIQCLLLAVELGSSTTSSAVVAAMRPAADGAVASLHPKLCMMLERISEGEDYNDEDVVAAAAAGTISLFVSLLHKDGKYYLLNSASLDDGASPCCLNAQCEDDIALISNLLQHMPSTVGALACTWLAASCQLRREDEGIDVSAASPQMQSVPTAHTELHMQLLNQVLVSNAHANAFVSRAAVYCLEELYSSSAAEGSETGDGGGISSLMQGWPSHVARITRDALMKHIHDSLTDEPDGPILGRAAATEAAERLATSHASRNAENGSVPLSSEDVMDDTTLARVLGAVITRWPTIGPDLFQPADTSLVVRHVAKQEGSGGAHFRALVSAFAELGMTSPAEEHESRACLREIDKYTQSLAYGIESAEPVVAWLPLMHGAHGVITVPVGSSCSLLCERAMGSTVWSY